MKVTAFSRPSTTYNIHVYTQRITNRLEEKEDNFFSVPVAGATAETNDVVRVDSAANRLLFDALRNASQHGTVCPYRRGALVPRLVYIGQRLHQVRRFK